MYLLMWPAASPGNLFHVRTWTFASLSRRDLPEGIRGQIRQPSPRRLTSEYTLTRTYAKKFLSFSYTRQQEWILDFL